MPIHIDKPIVDAERIARQIARALRAEIERRDLSLKELVEKSGIGQSAMSQYLGNRPTINEEIYRKIARAMGLSDNEFDEIVSNATIEYIQEKAPEAFERAAVAFSRKSGDLDAAYEVAIREVERIRKLKGL